MNPSVYGQAVTFTATVSANSPGSGTPTGSITFSQGSTTLGTASLSGGTASFTTSSPLAAGTDTIKASYSGDTNFKTSSGTVSQTVNKDATTTALASSANPSVYGQSVTFTATVSANAPGSGTPTGSVTFTNGSTTLATVTLSGGTASYSTAKIAIGSETITATYNGSNSFGTSNVSLTQMVNQDSTTTAITSGTNPSVCGQSVTFSVTVSANSPGSGTPTGGLTFMYGSTTLGTATLSSGKATLKTSALPAGSDFVSAVYSGDTNFVTSTGKITQTVNQDATATKLALSPATSVYGQSVTFTATVTASSPGNGTPTGAVTFYAGSTTLGTGTLGSGTATFSTSALAVGSNSISAVYSGDGNFLTSTSTSATETVKQDSSMTVVAASPSAPTAGQQVTLTATVSANSPGSGTPTGSVTYYVNGTSVGTFTLSGGSYGYMTSFSSAGTYTIKVSYSGDTNFKSSSVTMSLTVGSSADVVTASVPSATVDQAIGALPDESSPEASIGDLAFEQLSGTKSRAK